MVKIGKNRHKFKIKNQSKIPHSQYSLLEKEIPKNVWKISRRIWTCVDIWTCFCIPLSIYSLHEGLSILFFSLLFYSLPFPFRLHSCFPFSPSLLYSHLFLPLPSYSLLFFSLLIYSIRLSSLLVSSILFLPPHLFSLHFPSLSLSSPLLISLSSLLLSSPLSSPFFSPIFSSPFCFLPYRSSPVLPINGDPTQSR